MASVVWKPFAKGKIIICIPSANGEIDVVTNVCLCMFVCYMMEKQMNIFLWKFEHKPNMM